MIHMITGVVKAQYDQAIMVDIGTLGFLVQVPQNAGLEVGSTVSLHTYLHWNQEQGPSIFGFNTDIEREVFLLIISCTGIGPKIGLAVLAQLGYQAFIRAVQQEDILALSRSAGLGPKRPSKSSFSSSIRWRALSNPAFSLMMKGRVHLGTPSQKS
jgi:Holliday junction DNA helicase RuvA